MPNRVIRFPMGPVDKGVLEAPNAAVDLRGAFKRLNNVELSGVPGAVRVRSRRGTSVAMTFYDDQVTPAVVTTVVTLAQFGDGALVVGHSTVTDKVYVYRVTPDFSDWYDATGALQGSTDAEPVGVLWSGATEPPEHVWIAEGLGVAYFAHTDASNAGALSFPAKTLTLPGTIATLTSDLDSSGSSESLYFSLLISFQQHLWGAGFGSGTTAANGYRPELARFSRAIFDTTGGLFAPSDSLTLGDRVRSERERIVAGTVAGDALFLASYQQVTRVRGYGRDSWQKEALDKSYGVIGPRAMTSALDVAYWWSSRGPMRCEPGGLPEPLWTAIPTTVQAVNDGGKPFRVLATFDPASDLVHFFHQRNAATSSTLGDVNTVVSFDVRREMFVGPSSEIGVPIWGAGVVEPIYTSTAAPAAPAADPTAGSVTGVTTSSATVAWTNGDPLAETIVEYKRNSDSTWMTLTMSPGSTSTTLTGLLTSATGELYNWRVRHLRNGFYSNYSNGTDFTTIASGSTLAAPTGLTLASYGPPAHSWDDIGQVFWTNTEPAAQTEIWLKQGSGSYYLAYTAPVGVTSYEIGGPTGVTQTWCAKGRHVRTDFTPSAYTAESCTTLFRWSPGGSV